MSSYGITIMLAEAAAFKGCPLQNIDLEILRIPLIAKLITKRLTIPFGQFTAKRTMLQKSALIETILGMCRNREDSKTAQMNLHLLDDAHPVSTAELTTNLAKELNLDAQIFSVPMFLFKIAAFVGDILERCHLNFPISTAKLEKLNSTLILIPSFREMTKIEGLNHTKDL